MTENNEGKVVSVNGNLLAVEFDGDVSMNEICFVKVDGAALKSEVIRIHGKVAQVQVYEMTDGIQCGDEVEFTGEMLSALLGPGLLGQIYDGLQNPLPALAEKAGLVFGARRVRRRAGHRKKMGIHPRGPARRACCRPARSMGTVPERALYPQDIRPLSPAGELHAEIHCASKGAYTIERDHRRADRRARAGTIPVSMAFRWPVKRAVKCYRERLAPTETMETKVRLIDSFFPVAKGGTYCTPGPFGAGKTVLAAHHLEVRRCGHRHHRRLRRARRRGGGDADRVPRARPTRAPAAR